MSHIEKRIAAATEEVVRAINNDDKTVTFDLQTAELLVEGFTELWLINQEDRKRADEKFRKAMDHKFERLARKNDQLVEQQKKYRRALDENKRLKSRVAYLERKEMGRVDNMIKEGTGKGVFDE